MIGKKPELTEKQKLFVAEYLVDLNATQAAIRAGYSAKSAEAEGYKLAHKGRVGAEIARAMAARSRRTGITQDRVLREIARVAFVNPDSVIDFGTGELKTDASPDDLACVASCKVKTSSFGEAGESVEREIKMNDKIKALDMLCRHLGMYSDGKGGTAGADADKGETGVIQMPAVMDTPNSPEDEVMPDA